MATMVQTTCPGCRKTLQFTREQITMGVSCPVCGRQLRLSVKLSGAPAPTAALTQRAALAKIPAPLPDGPEPLDDPPPLPRRRPSRNFMPLVLIGVAVLGFGTLGIIFGGDIWDALTAGGPPRKERDKSDTAQNLLSAATSKGKETANKPTEPGTAPTMPTPTETGRKPEPTKHSASKPSTPPEGGNQPSILAPTRPGRQQLGRRFKEPYPGRALLIGVRNYLYANPLNPGYQDEQSLGKDPLGLGMLARALVEDGMFPKDQVAHLSDVAQPQPNPPTKDVLQGTITEFLGTSRAADRIMLVFVGHVVLVKDQAYLVPIEGEMEKPESLIPVTWLYEVLAKCPARQKLLIVDVSPHDPEFGQQRSAPDKLDPKLHAQLHKHPQGVQVWLSCGAGQTSHLYASSGMQGSIFIDTLCKHAFLNKADIWRLIEKDPALPDGSLPLALLAPHVNRRTAEFAKSRAKADQMPTLSGTELAFTGAPASGAPPKVAIKEGGAQERKADNVLVSSIMKELGIPEAARSLPPFKADALQKYVADYENEKELQAKLKDHPLRKATLQAQEQLKAADRNIRGFRRNIRHNANEANFRREVERLQQIPASVQGELEEALVLLERAGKSRDKEKSPRWQAHYDFTMLGMLTKLIQVQEYNFVLGNKLRKDAPPLKDKANNGWQLVTQSKLQLKESRDLAKKRDKLLEKIEKDYPDTPWTVLAKRDKSTALGLDIQEGRVD
jgi:hypothetical protein